MIIVTGSKRAAQRIAKAFTNLSGQRVAVEILPATRLAPWRRYRIQDDTVTHEVYERELFPRLPKHAKKAISASSWQSDFKDHRICQGV